MNAYVINLGAAKARWQAMLNSFAGTSVRLIRVDAINGNSLDLSAASFSERGYHLLHGRSVNPLEIGCYLSHLRACELLLESGEEHGLICEDDLTVRPGFDAVLDRLLHFASYWDIARLSGLREDTGDPVLRLNDTHSIRVHFGRLKGAGAYLINRSAARRMVKELLPMKLPFDHAVDREWVCGLRGVSVIPFPISQVEARFPTSIQRGRYEKFSPFRRLLTTYPYQACNEMNRWIFRGLHLLRLSMLTLDMASRSTID